MTLEDLGYTNDLEEYRKKHQLDVFEIGRVISEHKERYVVKTADAELEAEIIGNLRFTATSRADFPAVGDWVDISVYDSNKALIHAIFPRSTVLERKSVSKNTDKQLIAVNVDVAFIMQAVDRDFSLNRLERYLTICHKARVRPVIILNKIDLVGDEELHAMCEKVKNRTKDTQVIAISNISGKGYDGLLTLIEKGKTYCLLGSSGVGKSTMINQLVGAQKMHTYEISSHTNKGKHTTSHRELISLANGGLLIDNPGMREVGIADSADGLERTFETVANLAKVCRFKDCSHTTEVGCAVLEALERGELDALVYENYLKMEREKVHYEQSVSEKRRKEKEFGKMLKNFKKDIQKVSSKHQKGSQ
jgi:ribosome biogenesis GTPase